MFEVVTCMTLEHDLKLVVLSALLCIVGSLVFVQLLRRALGAQGHTRSAWAVMGAFALATTVWCTHFIALLAFKSKVPVTIDPVLTMVSLVVPMIGFYISITIFMISRAIPNSALGAIFLGLCVSGLHFTGMAAYRVDGLVEWNYGYVIAATLLSCVFTLAAGLAFRAAPNSKFHLPAVGLFSVGVISLHFTGVAAMKITPLRLSDTPLDSSTFIGLSFATALAGFLVIATGAVSFFIDQDTRKTSYEKLLKMAMSDHMTGLPNRYAYMERLDEDLRIATERGEHLAVLGIDLDHFKEINDTHGHKAGDEVLKNISQAFTRNLKQNEFIARLGGDEFAAVKRFEDPYQLEGFIGRLEAALTVSTDYDASVLVAGGSIGIAHYPEHGKTTDELRNNADLAMYRAKLNPSRNVCFYEPSMDEEVRLKRDIAAELARSIDEDRLELHYQPQASTANGRLVGMEALLRWTHPRLGCVSPAVFIPVAEETKLIVRLGEWVLRKACSDAAKWTGSQKVAVNVSAVQLNQVELPQIIHQILLDTGLPPTRLEIELTETAILEDRHRALHVLRQIKALGIGIALDDFGTGYSSIEILRAFPFDKIKLDRFFMAEIESSREGRALIRSVLLLGHSLSIPVLAEGVETESQLAILRDEGCDEVQGFLIGKPMPAPAKLGSHTDAKHLFKSDKSSKPADLINVA